MTSYGFWYPWAVIDVYKGNTVFTFTYEGSSYFGYEVEEPGERKRLIPLVDRAYRFLSLDERAQEIPLLSLVLSPGAMFFLWTFVLCFLVRPTLSGMWSFCGCFCRCFCGSCAENQKEKQQKNEKRTMPEFPAGLINRGICVILPMILRQPSGCR